MSKLIPLLAAATVFATASANADTTDARKALRDFSACVADKTPNVARQLVFEDWSSTQMLNHKSGVINSRCMGTTLVRMQLRAQGPLMKFAIAEALWRKDRLSIDASRLSAIPLLTYRMPPPVATHYPDSGKPLKPNALAAEQRGHDSWLSGVALAQFGECVVRADTASAVAVLDTPIGTPAELAAIQALNPAMSKCLSNGQTIGFNRSSVRGAIAVASYRLALATRGQTWAGDTTTSGKLAR